METATISDECQALISRFEQTEEPLSTEEQAILTTHYARVRLALAYRQYELDKVIPEQESERLDAGRHLACLAQHLGRDRVEALVREVEQTKEAQVPSAEWEVFVSAVVVESYEGRYAGYMSTLDPYREAYGKDNWRYPAHLRRSMTEREAEIRTNVNERLGGLSPAARNALVILVSEPFPLTAPVWNFLIDRSGTTSDERAVVYNGLRRELLEASLVAEGSTRPREYEPTPIGCLVASRHVFGIQSHKDGDV